MLVVNQKFYGYKGEEITIVSKGNVTTMFSNGTTHLNFEVELALKNEKTTRAVSVSNRLELERLKEKYKTLD